MAVNKEIYGDVFYASVGIIFVFLVLSSILLFFLKQSPALENRVYPLLQAGLWFNAICSILAFGYFEIDNSKDKLVHDQLPTIVVAGLCIFAPIARIIQYTRMFIFQNAHVLTLQKLCGSGVQPELTHFDASAVMPSQLYLLTVCGFKVKRHVVDGMNLLAIDTRVSSFVKAGFHMAVFNIFCLPMLLSGISSRNEISGEHFSHALSLPAFELICACLGMFTLVKIARIDAPYGIRAEYLASGIMNLFFSFLLVILFILKDDLSAFVYLLHNVFATFAGVGFTFVAHFRYRLQLHKYNKSSDRMKLSKFSVEIANPEFRSYLRPFMASDMSLENLYFIEQYFWAKRVLQAGGVSERDPVLTSALYDDFIPQGSLNELNLSYTLRDEIQRHYANYELRVAHFERVFESIVSSIYFNSYMRSVINKQPLAAV